MCGRYPGKLIGFAKHDPQSEAGRIPGMLRCEVEQLGLKGLKLHKLPTRDVLEAVAELRIPVLYHPQEVSDWTELDWRCRYPNVSVDTSQVPVKYIEMAVKELGPDKIIFWQ